MEWAGQSSIGFTLLDLEYRAEVGIRTKWGGEMGYMSVLRWQREVEW